MADTSKTLTTMVKNIEAKTGKSLAQLAKVVKASGLAKHGEIRAMLMKEFGLGHGAANAVVHLSLQSDGEGAAKSRGLSMDQVLNEIYVGKKASLRPIHDRILELLDAIGSFEAAPKKGYVSYRRKKQFAMVGPKTNSAVEIGFGATSLPAHARLKVMPPNSMCRYTVRVSAVGEVDGQVRKWLAASFAQAG